ncbi:alpha/beta hydrolase fold protein [Candidatus Nitrosoglobus terrae]|uniref:Alpha/beta hydrolase fold protein n=1 Tax=Candidatus Nitrosoglobus terrae TaxID=1630141 RepID=A0A1Q2SMG1_9GAMM|nr:hydrolase [Candidatus Nitrosoglobus terrae]BAW80297.1 alpha/beta hydrolase fold protein [Candidatus Nitrosoglobus terrae]
MIIPSSFQPAWWLPNPHAQTLWGARFRPLPSVRILWERLELLDGDFLDLVWSGQGNKGPIIIILHGLEGSYRSRYASGILKAIAQRGWRGVLLHFRSCSGEPNRLDRSYHSGDTGDLQTVLKILHRREPDTPLAAIGYSLGGNVLFKWLGNQGKQTGLIAAVGVSVPFDLSRASWRLEQGFSQIYQWSLIKSLQRSLKRKFRHRDCPFNLNTLKKTKTFKQFDDLVTAPLHGFIDANDYWQRSSCRQFLSNIQVPTLILHSTDDPFLPKDAIPLASELSPTTQLELSTAGGHVGFISGHWPWQPEYWLEQRIITFFNQHLGTKLAT